MKNLSTKYIKIKYNKKIFQIFSDKKHNFLILEVKGNQNGIDFYDFPEFKDFCYLSQIFNNNFTSKVNSTYYSRRKRKYPKKALTIQQKVKIGLRYIEIASVTFGIGIVLSFCVDQEYYHPKGKIFSPYYQVSKDLYNIFASDLSEMEDVLCDKDISREEMINIARGNPNILLEDTFIIERYINSLYDKFPYLDKRLFESALKEFTIIHLPELPKKSLKSGLAVMGDADLTTKVIRLAENEHFCENFFHELTHFIFENIIKKNDQTYYKKVSLDSGFFGSTLVEGITSYTSLKLFDSSLASYSGYQKDYHYIQRLISMVGEKDLLMTVSEKNIYALEDMLKERSGMPRQVSTVMRQADCINSIIQDVEICTEDVDSYMDSEIDVFFGIQKNNLDNNSLSINEYINNRNLYIQNILQNPKYIKLFWEKEHIYMQKYLNLINKFKISPDMIYSISFCKGKTIEQTYDIYNMTVALSEINGEHKIRLISNDEIDYKIDYITNYPISEEEKITKTVSLYDYLEVLKTSASETKNTIENYDTFSVYNLKGFFNETYFNQTVSQILVR